eukprot:SAG31_NODE_168_length_21484_cov_21.524994_3_plen_92_part_00
MGGLPASDSRFVYSVNARSEATLGFWQGAAMRLQIQNGRHGARDATASYATRISVGPGTSSVHASFFVFFVFVFFMEGVGGWGCFRLFSVV